MSLTPVRLDDVPFSPERIMTTLAHHAVDFVVIGGVAALLSGYFRGTQDLDTTARATEDNLERLCVALRDMDARLLVEVNAREHATLDVDITPRTFIDMTSVHLLTIHGVLDVVLRPDGIEDFDVWLVGSEDLYLEDGAVVRYASLDDVITSKAASGRAKDIERLPELRALRDRSR